VRLVSKEETAGFAVPRPFRRKCQSCSRALGGSNCKDSSRNSITNTRSLENTSRCVSLALVDMIDFITHPRNNFFHQQSSLFLSVTYNEVVYAQQHCKVCTRATANKVKVRPKPEPENKHETKLKVGSCPTRQVQQVEIREKYEMN
jgi:hypothetical protein